MAPPLSRRRVLGLTTAGIALSAVGGWRLVGKHHLFAAEVGRGWSADSETRNKAKAGSSGEPPALVIVRDEAATSEPAAMVDAALSSLGGMERFVSKGQKVLVKPNIGWDRTPDLAADTNPQVVARVVEHCLQAGAASVLVMDRTCNDPRRCYVNSGIQQAAEAAGAEVRHPDDDRTTTVDLKGRALNAWEVYDAILSTDVRINVPIAKVHGLAGLTLGMKNWMGCVGGRRGRMHQHIHKAVVDLAAFFQPQLTILDAWRVLTANGPQGGKAEDVATLRTLAASADPLAVDTFGASLFGRGPDDLRYLAMAEERGLGSRDLASLSVREISPA